MEFEVLTVLLLCFAFGETPERLLLSRSMQFDRVVIAIVFVACLRSQSIVYVYAGAGVAVLVLAGPSVCKSRSHACCTPASDAMTAHDCL